MGTAGNDGVKNGVGKCRNHKRTGKARFTSNAKGFGKKGMYGRGTHIKDDQFNYFIQIWDAMTNGFESLEDKVTMANNVFEQTTGEEIHLSSNQVVSRVIEALVGFTSTKNFERFQQKFGENLRPICSDKFASHILQKIIEISFLRTCEPEGAADSEPVSKKTKAELLSERMYHLATEFPEHHRQKCSTFVLQTGKFLLNNLEDFIQDPYANHIMRTSIFCLTGIHVDKTAFRKDSGKCAPERTYSVPKEWTNVVVEYANRLQLWPQFSDLPYSELSSALLGNLCIALKKIDKNILKKFGKKILFDSFLTTDKGDTSADKSEIDSKVESQETAGHLAKIFESPTAIRLLETLLVAAGKKLFTQLYGMLFAGHLKELSLNRLSNFSVQRLIENVKYAKDFELIFDEVAEGIEDFLRVGHTGVVSALSATCLRLCTKQGAFVTTMQKALHTDNLKENPEALFNCLLKLKPYQVALEDKTQFVHLNGSIIIQNILRFNKPIFMVNAILSVPSHNLAAIFSTSNGSYVVDVFLDSKYVGEKSREKLIRHLEGCYTDMAVTKFGSRAVEGLFNASSDAQKCRIAKELVDKSNQLNATIFGGIIFNKFRLKTYRLTPNQWKASFDKAQRAEKLFKGIL